MKAITILRNCNKRKEKRQLGIVKILRNFRIEASIALSDREEADWLLRHGEAP
jgi:hypothetical protein